MIFHTLSQSIYEVNLESNQIRRLDGINPPEPKQGNDGEWKSFWAISPIKLNHPVVIAWTSEEVNPYRDDSKDIGSSMTSCVVKIV